MVFLFATHVLNILTDCGTQVLPLVKKLADCVIPAEYGITPQYKLQIGQKIAKELVSKLLLDLENVKTESFSADQDLRARTLETGRDGEDIVRGSETSLPGGLPMETVKGADTDLSLHGGSGDEVRLHNVCTSTSFLPIESPSTC
jgi:hypothetical protein